MTNFTREDLKDTMKAIVSDIVYTEAPLRYGPNEFIVIIPALRRLMPGETFPMAFPVREKKRVNMDITIYDGFIYDDTEKETVYFRTTLFNKGLHVITKNPDRGRSRTTSFMYYWIRKQSQ